MYLCSLFGVTLASIDQDVYVLRKIEMYTTVQQKEAEKYITNFYSSCRAFSLLLAAKQSYKRLP
jgi:hypothetical protein